jgi:AraC-like DNA-binding protein
MTELLFIDVIQRHFERVRREGTGDASNWFVALTDPVVGDALAQIHREPARDWSLQELATSVGASRSALAERFTEVVGISPMRYLASWRMELAGQRMLGTPEAIGEIAVAVGYESEAAFNRAFKRHAGEPPAAWRRRHRKQGALA